MCVSAPVDASRAFSLALISHLFLDTYLFSNETEKEDMDSGRWGGGEDLGCVEGEETVIKIYYMKKIYSQKKNKKQNTHTIEFTEQ